MALGPRRLLPGHAGALERLHAAQGHGDGRVEVGAAHAAQGLDGHEERGADGEAGEERGAHEHVALLRKERRVRSRSGLEMKRKREETRLKWVEILLIQGVSSDFSMDLSEGATVKTKRKVPRNSAKSFEVRDGSMAGGRGGFEPSQGHFGARNDLFQALRRPLMLRIRSLRDALSF